MAEIAAVLDEDRPQETPAAIERDGPRGPGADRLHLRHHRRAARRRPRLPLPVRPADPGRALVRLAQGRPRLVHDRDRLVEVGPQRLPRPLADRRRRGHPRRPLRPGRAARLRRGARRQRALPGADRVPDAGPAHRPAPAARAAADGLGRRAAGPGDDRRLPRGDRPRARRRLRPDRDRPGDRQPRRRAGPPGLDGQAAAGHRDPHRGARASGELQLRAASSPTFFSRYLDGERFEGEWWPTGDLVRADDDGYLFFEGRDDDIILSSGYRIGPTEVESALLSHPAVAEAAAVAAPDPERGAVVRAIVVPRDREPSEELARELQEHCKRETAPYKFPRIVEFAAELPKTSSGKIKRASCARSRLSLRGVGGCSARAPGLSERRVGATGRPEVDSPGPCRRRTRAASASSSSSWTNSAIVVLPRPRAIWTIALHGQLVGVVAGHVADEGAVDLDHVEGDPLQVVEGAEAGAVVVDRDFAAELGQAVGEAGGGRRSPRPGRSG